MGCCALCFLLPLLQKDGSWKEGVQSGYVNTIAENVPLIAKRCWPPLLSPVCLFTQDVLYCDLVQSLLRKWLCMTLKRAAH